jgi:hypothetical protein
MNNTDAFTRPPHTRTSSYQSDAEGAKRRSMLPQPGQSRLSMYHPDSVASKADGNVPQAVPGRLRPRSMYQPGSIQPLQGKNEEQKASSRTLRPTSGISKPSETQSTGRKIEDSTPTMRSMRPPNGISKPSDSQTTGLSRSRSLRKPGPTTQSTQPPLSTGHGRTQSTSTISALRKEVSSAESSLARPRSLLAAPSSRLKSKAVVVEPAPQATRASTRLAGLSRTASVKTKPEVMNSGVPATLVSRPDDPRRQEVPKEDSAKTARPAFSTLQQHFTPRKVGKAPTSTFLHLAPAPGSNSLPPEVINIQSELLQLHLLHATSAKVSDEWQLSARRNLHKKFDEVSSLHQVMLEYERTGREQNNLQALLEWSAGASSLGLVEYIQILSGPLHELPSLLEPGGRFERLADEYERWTSRVEHAWSTRISSTPSKSNLESVEGLDDTWKAENAALVRKVTSFARDLEQVRQPSPGSSIACIIESCTELLGGLSEELHIMQATELQVVEKENEWVEARLQAIARDVSSYSVHVDDEVAVWRM